MAVEKLIKKEGTYIKAILFAPIRVTYMESSYCYEYWYDGRKFVIGSDGKDYIMVDVETGIYAAKAAKPVKNVIDLFKERLDKSGKTIHEVVRDAKIRFQIFEPWSINFLTI